MFRQQSGVLPDPGNTLSSARDLGELSSTLAIADWVGSSDTLDYYRFSTRSSSSFNAVLDGLRGDADIRLYRINPNGSTTFLASSTRGGTNTDSIQNRFLARGNYAIRINRFGNNNTSYNLGLSAIPTASGSDNSVSRARDLGDLGSTVAITDWVGRSDTVDYYRFSTRTFSRFNVVLDGLRGDADLRLYRINPNGSTTFVTSSTRGGIATDSIQNWFLTRGNYAIRVNRFSTNNTSYNLQLSALPTYSGSDNSVSRARDLGQLGMNMTIPNTNWVGRSDTVDYYRFSLSGSRRFNAILDGLRRDADLRLYRINPNGSITFLASSTRGGTNTDSIQNRFLTSGNYAIRVNRFSTNNTSYNLNLSAYWSIG